MGAFDPEHIASFFDEYGEREWERHELTPGARVSLEVHRAFLRDHVAAGDLVLDAGAGPGRFTIELTRLGARVHVGDISPGQLRLNETRLAEAGLEEAVVGRELLDICDLGRFAAGTFDAVVCFGGPLSYVRERADDALAELVRVTRPGGVVLLSVMSTIGAMRAFLDGVIAEERAHGPGHTERIFRTGGLERDTNNGQEMTMYRWSELAALCARHGEVTAAATANFLTAGRPPALDEATPEELERIMGWELRLCREPGVLDGGTHMLAALRTPAPA
jgi:SAM-dependent methyltransferase